jgi:hypothetical protein
MARTCTKQRISAVVMCSPKGDTLSHYNMPHLPKAEWDPLVDLSTKLLSRAWSALIIKPSNTKPHVRSSTR